MEHIAHWTLSSPLYYLLLRVHIVSYMNYIILHVHVRALLHQVVQVKGNLKVKLPPLRREGKVPVRAAEPEVMGFTGECRVIESLSSIVEISVSHSTFTMLKNSEKQMTYIEAS